jgi:hypothetical protein
VEVDISQGHLLLLLLLGVLTWHVT